MRWAAVLAVFLAIAGCSGEAARTAAPGTSVARESALPPSVRPERVEFPSGALQLHGLLWRPAGEGPFPAVLFNHGSGGATAAETARMPIEEAASRLAPPFLRRGYAFFYPFRRGQGASADAAPFLQDLLTREERAHGREARQQLQDRLLQTEQLEDVLAALAYLRRAPGVDPDRIVVMGHSFGGQLTLLAAAREPTVRAAVTFAAAAGSWPRSAEVRRTLRDAVSRARCPILLVQWRNDFTIDSSLALGAEATSAGSPPRVLLYPPVGSTREDGHSGLYLAMDQWEADVLLFVHDALTR